MHDVFKDTLLRLFGYAGQVGEACRPVAPPSWVRLGYTVSSAYILADALHKGWTVSQRANFSSKAKPLNVITAFGDTLIWQAFASVIIPGFTIKGVVWVTGNALSNVAHLPSPLRKFAPTVVGLCVIPLIMLPVDQGVSYVMDNTIRNVYNYHPWH